jgi:hypothetical protein
VLHLLSRARSWVLIAAGLSPACGGADNLTEPVTGTLEITSSIVGSPTDAGGFTLQVDARPAQPIAVGETFRLPDLPPGSHTIEMRGLAPRCSVEGMNPRTVTISPGQTTTVSVSIVCTAAVGSIRVTSTTTGSSPDSDGYTVTVDGVERGPLQLNSEATYEDLAPGAHTVALGDLASNCVVDGDNPRGMLVVPGSTVVAAFAVTCVTIGGRLALTTQPSAEARSGVKLARQPVVQLEDPQHRPRSERGVSVQVSLTSGGTLSGTLTHATDEKGQVAYTDLVIPGDPGEYTLSFDAPGSAYAGVTSNRVLIRADPGEASGIVFASFDMDHSLFGPVHTGSVRQPSPSSLLPLLAGARTKRARVILKLAGSDNNSQNADGTFNLARWKSMVDRFKDINFSSYIADGTLLGHYLLDEPHFQSKWGGTIVPQSIVEEMAQYSKQLWPAMTTMISSPPRWLTEAGVNYSYLDAAFAQFEWNYGSTWIGKEVAAAKAKGLGLVVSLNLLDGGDGTSGIPGTYGGRWAMSASEVRSYGSAMLAESYICGFTMWKYTPEYYSRPDMQSAMADLSIRAENHASTSCRQ